jgi:TolB-like protein/Tfp pilus assembly protein PilF
VIPPDRCALSEILFFAGFKGVLSFKRSRRREQLSNFLGEMKRRELFRVGLAYLIIGWFVVEVASEVLPTFGAADWILKVVMIVVAVGFPVVLMIAWAFEIAAPKGKKEKTRPQAPADEDSRRIERSSIAVLPFDLFSDQAGDEHLTDGITEDLITTLSHSPYLFVTARNATQKYRGAAHDFAAIGKALRVHYVVEGSVRRVGDQIRLNVQLIETESGTHAWAEKFDLNPEEFPAVLDTTVRAIASALSAKVFMSEVARAKKANLESLDAWGIIHRAYLAFELPSKSTTDEGLELLQKAIELEPGYAMGHAMIAMLSAVRVLNILADDPEAELKSGRDHARKALALEPGADFCHSAMGLLALAEGRFENAAAAFHNALEKAPNNPLHTRLLGLARILQGEPDEGIAMIEESRKLAPRGAAAGYRNIWLAFGHLLLGENQAVLDTTNKAVEQMGDLFALHFARAAALQGLGRNDEALAAATAARNVLPQFSIDHIQEQFCRYSAIGQRDDLFDPLFDALRESADAGESENLDAV